MPLYSYSHIYKYKKSISVLLTFAIDIKIQNVYIYGGQDKNSSSDPHLCCYFPLKIAKKNSKTIAFLYSKFCVLLQFFV